MARDSYRPLGGVDLICGLALMGYGVKVWLDSDHAVDAWEKSIERSLAPACWIVGGLVFCFGIMMMRSRRSS